MAQDSNLAAEVEAIGAVLSALEPLPGPARERVIAYAIDVLDVHAVAGLGEYQQSVPPSTHLEPQGSTGAPDTGSPQMTDIRTLKEAKKPSSSTEMAALVGYYLAELAPAEEKKTDIGQADLEKYFKQANYPLPSAMRNVLPSAASSGYFDNVGRGSYRLNPVGYNLVVHSLPAAERTSSIKPRKRSSRAAKKADQQSKKASGKRPAKKAAKRSPRSRSS